MRKTLTQVDIEDGKKISVLFSEASDISKAMALSYLSALRDKETSDSGKEKELQKV